MAHSIGEAAIDAANAFTTAQRVDAKAGGTAATAGFPTPTERSSHKALSACEQFREVGKLGAQSTAYSEWTALIVGHCEDLRPGAGPMLHKARRRNEAEVDDAFLVELTLSSGWSREAVERFSGELYSVLMSKTTGDSLRSVLAVQAGGALPPSLRV